MRLKVIVILACAVAPSLMLWGSAFAQGPPFDGPGPGMHGFGPGGPGGPEGGPRRGFDGPPGPVAPPPEVLEQLGLSEAQSAKLGDLRDEEMRKVIRLEADARIAEIDLRRLIEGDAPDGPAIDRLIDRISTLRGEILKARVATALGVRSVLTADQRAKLRRAMARFGRPPGPDTGSPPRGSAGGTRRGR